MFYSQGGYAFELAEPSITLNIRNLRFNNVGAVNVLTDNCHFTMTNCTVRGLQDGGEVVSVSEKITTTHVTLSSSRFEDVAGKVLRYVAPLSVSTENISVEILSCSFINVTRGAIIGGGGRSFVRIKRSSFSNVSSGLLTVVAAPNSESTVKLSENNYTEVKDVKYADSTIFVAGVKFLLVDTSAFNREPNLATAYSGRSITDFRNTLSIKNVTSSIIRNCTFVISASAVNLFRFFDSRLVAFSRTFFSS